ncbi:MAG: hypothetical protein KDA75_14950, partial [Planctomycetaceae bacterium]|nr:hypothetical protein [Planctomycetaceae bacterium]
MPIAVVEEAARAIHDDASIPAALPALAARLGSSAPDADGFVRRAISANLRVGGEAAARRLAAFAADGAHAPAMRAEALASLATWAKTEPLDRVQGAYRGSEERDLAPAHAALDAHIAALLAATEKPVRDALAKAIKQLNYGNAADRMAGIALDGSQPADARAAALEALAALGSPKLPAAIEAALGADSPLLRLAGIDAQFARAPGDPAMLAAVARALASADTAEAQHAMRALGKVGGAKAEAMLGEKLG